MGTKTYTIQQLWHLACQFDDIDPRDKFVVFSADNPYAKKYNFAMCAALACQQGAN